MPDMVSIFERPAALALAQRCKMGDITAMEELAQHFRGLCAPETQALLKAYEARPDQQREQALKAYLSEHTEELLPAEAYIMWLLRAARFGSEHIQSEIDRLPYYASFRTVSRRYPHQPFPRYLPFRALLGRWERNSERPAWGKCLRDAGFPDVPGTGAGDEFYITFWPSPGVYRITYQDGYIPADESGFGAEYEYSSIWLDEFFCPLAAKKPEDLSAELERMDREREKYWEDSGRSGMGRKYQQRLRISKELVWGRTLGEIAPLLGVEIS